MAYFTGMKPFTCCICGKRINGEWGNNPAPVNNDEDAKCCDACDCSYVIPARIKQLTSYNPTKAGRR